MRYRKKPVEIDAEQFVPDRPSEQWPKGVELTNMMGARYAIWDEEQKCPVRVNPGDWIITGVKNEKYPCSDEVFQRTYEPVL